MIRLPMVNWFDPVLLIGTALREVVSTLFGEFADRRETIASANAIDSSPPDPSFDYSEEKGDFWFDYLADTGDGWNSTYAMARLSSADAVRLDDAFLPRGRLLVLGGDQVYPTASRDNYQQRFRAPFEEAYAPGGVQSWAPDSAEAPDLYALPGDHDWHDGLNAFSGLFCRRRMPLAGTLGTARSGAVVAGRQTRQTRSYFALKLPGGWWLWGTDSQMKGYIDQPQIDYFHHVATHWMAPHSKLVLCVGEPVWANAVSGKIDERYRSFSYLERLAGSVLSPQSGESMGHRLKLVLTGDSHHYSRFLDDDARAGRHYITCGGGGASTSATHQLGTRIFPGEYPPPGVDGAKGLYVRTFRIADDTASDPSTGPASDRAPDPATLYPSAATSRRLAWRNLAFPVLNRQFTLLLAGIFLTLDWILAFNASAIGNGSGNFATLLRRGDFPTALDAYGRLALLSPTAPILLALLLGTTWALADAKDKPMLRLLLGLGHMAVQVVAAAAASLLVVRLTASWWDGGWGSAAILMGSGLAAGLVASSITGLYFIFTMNALRRQTGYGFASLKIQGFKSFLRLQIGEDASLTVHAIGLRNVPSHRSKAVNDEALHPHLIEKIVIMDR